MTTLRGQMASGAAWMILFKLMDRGIGLASTIILARLLMPGDFGLVAMAMSVIALLELMGAFGLDVALIQRQSPTREHYDTAWSLNVLAGLTIGIALLVLSHPIAAFYREPRLASVVQLLALASAVQGLANIGVVAFQKDMEFHREFAYLFGRRLITFFVVVPLALVFRNYWALAIGMTVGRLAGVGLSYLMHPFRPRFSMTRIGDLFHFSKWLMLQNLLAFAKERSADFVIGRTAGPHGLGLFSVSSEIASLPGTELVAPINRAVLPGYAKLGGDIDALRREYLAVMSVITLIAVPAVAGLAAVAYPTVMLMLGSKWSEAAPLLATLAVFGIAQVIQSNAYSAFIALGRPRAFVEINATYVAVLLPLLLLLTWAYGIRGAAISYVVTAIIVVPISLFMIARALKIAAPEFLSCLWRPLVSSAVMYGAVTLAGQPLAMTNLATAGAAALALLILVPTGVAAYLLTLTLLWHVSGRPEGAERMVVSKVVERVRAALAARKGHSP